MEGPGTWSGAVLAVLFAMLLAACGCCNLDYVPNHDIVVLKLAAEGTLEWTRVIDRGFDDAAEDIVALPDGGYAVAGGTSDARFAPPRPILIRLSPEGAIAWERFATDEIDVANAVMATPDGGTAVLTGNGTVVRFDPDGMTLWAQATGIPEARALARTADGGFLAGGRITYQVPVNGTAENVTVVPPPLRTTATERGGDCPVLAEAASRPTTPELVRVPRRFDLMRKAMVVRLAPGGAVEWERQYTDGGLTWLQSLAGGSARTGFAVAGYNDTLNGSVYVANPLLLLHVAPDGTPGPVTRVDSANVGDRVWLRSDPDGYRVLYQNRTEGLTAAGNYDGYVLDATLDRDGRVLGQRALDASIAVTWTDDGGYFSIGTPPAGDRSSWDTGTYHLAGGDTFHARRFDSAGALLRDRVLPGIPCDQVLKVVQTADGGYVVLASRQNR